MASSSQLHSLKAWYKRTKQLLIPTIHSGSHRKKHKRLKTKYVLGQMFKALIGLVLLLALLWLIDLFFKEPIDQLLTHLRAERIKIYAGSALSELLLGLLPPDIFILALPKVPVIYIQGVLILGSISHTVGFINYFLGKKFSTTKLYTNTIGRLFKRELRQLKRFGGLLIVLSALTPISFSVVCILVGAMHYPFRSFLIFSTSRLFRFALYGYLLWPIGGS